MASPTAARPATYELVDANWTVQDVRQGRRRWWAVGLAAVFGAITIASAVVAAKDHAAGNGYWIYPMLLGLVFLWFTGIEVLESLFASAPLATAISITSRGIALDYPEPWMHFDREWNDGELRIVLRDFRPWPMVDGEANPLASSVVLDTGDRSIVFGIVVPSTRPPSAFLSDEAFKAIIAEARARGLGVSQSSDTRWKASPGWFFPDVTTRITPPIDRQ